MIRSEDLRYPAQEMKASQHQPLSKAEAVGILPIFAAVFLAWTLPAQQLFFNSDNSGDLTFSYLPNAPALQILHQPANQLAAVGDARGLSVLALGSGPLQYQWQFNSNNIIGATRSTLLLTNISLADFGAYRAIVSDGASSLTSSNALLQLDSDRDGMADVWEIAHFGSITNRNGSEDYDGDGVSDRDEFLEGTDPKNFNSVNPRLTIYSDRGEVFVTPDVPLFTNNQTITLTGVPDPGFQFLGYLGQPYGGGPFYNVRTNPATIRFGTIGMAGSQVIRAIFGLPLPFALDVTNGWRIDQAGWYGQTNVTHDGVAAAQSARIFGTEEAWLELTNVVLASEGTITFWWKVDGTPKDQLRFFRNNLLRSGAIGTNTDWQQRTYYLPAGTNVVRWVYHKEGNEVSEYNGLFYAPADAGWVDEVSYAPWPDPLLDTDGDGLPDIWEYKYFDTLAYGPNDDPDGDGVSNLDEYLDHTDPTSNISLLPRLHVLSSNGGLVARQPDLPKYTYGQTVQLQAVPDPTNYFLIWGGALSGTNTTNSILMNRNYTVSAVFGLPLAFALNTPSLTWTRNSPLGFFGQTNISLDGVCSAQAGPVGFHEESAMETSVAGPGTLVFWWKASCPTNVNFGRFLLDGVEQPGKITGETTWQPQSFYLGSGSHLLRWNYTNNLANASLTNGVWVDQVFFTQGTIAPTIVAQPTDVLGPTGYDVTFQVTVTGTPPFSYQWFQNNVSLGPTATGAILTVTNVSLAQAGSYHVVVSNSVQSVTSQSASLTVLPVPPVNDNFANSTPLTGTNSVFGYTFGATREIGEPYHAGVFGSHSVWWSWTAPSAGDFRLSVVATNVGTPLAAAVYTGTSVSAITQVQSGVGTVTPDNSSVSVLSFAFNATAGTVYSLAVDHGGSTMGFLSLSVVPSTAPVFSSSAIASGGTFGFDFAAPPGASYEIEASSDLQTWTVVANGIVPPNGIVSFTDPVSGGSAGKFYRIRLF